MSLRSSTLTGRALALLGAALATVLWWHLVFGGVDPLGATAGPPAWIAAVLFPTLYWLGVGAALRDAPIVTALTGLIGLFPVGLSFLLMPGPYRLLGVAPLLLIAGAVVLIRAARSDATP